MDLAGLHDRFKLRSVLASGINKLRRVRAHLSGFKVSNFDQTSLCYNVPVMAGIDHNVPTILVVGNDRSLDPLVNSLQLDGCLVLMAMDWHDAFRIIAIHSRPVQILLAHHNVNGQGLAEALKPSRLAPMHVVQVNGNIDAALVEVREHFNCPIAPPPRQKSQAA